MRGPTEQRNHMCATGVTGHSICLNNHDRNHMGEKPYECEKCDKSFNKSFLEMNHE